MAKRLEITSVNITEKQVNINVDTENVKLIEGTVPSGRILADSDGLAFIYILESEDDFIYLSLKSEVWNKLKQGMDQSLPYVLQYGEHEMVLDAFIEELEQRIDNIEGNSNYGKTMVDEVEKVFLSK